MNGNYWGSIAVLLFVWGLTVGAVIAIATYVRLPGSF